MTDASSFPRLYARTQRFTLGAPRDLAVSHDGSRVTFLRSSGPEDPVNALWRLDVESGEELLVADPWALLAAGGGAEVPAEEQARRERARESAGGIVAYATDRDGRVAVAALGGRLVVADVPAGTARLVDVPGPVFDPRPDPTGTRVAWARGRELWAAELDEPTSARRVAGEDDPLVSWGQADFIAAEEMGRQRGYWWSPDGESLLVARVDESPVDRWWIADPAHPGQQPREVRYPAAGRANADVSLWICALDGTRHEVRWDRAALPYLATAAWDEHGPLLSVQSRDQRELAVLGVEPDGGATTDLVRDHDDDWVELVPGTPTRLSGGGLVTCADRGGVRRLLVDGEPVELPAELQVRSVVDAGDREVVFLASSLGEPTKQHVWRWRAGGGCEPVIPADGDTHSAAAGGGTVVIRSAGLDHDGDRVRVVDGPEIASRAATSPLRPAPTLRTVTERRLAIAVLRPARADPGEQLPVLLDPYGGPHAQRVVRARNAYLSSQWFAEQGFVVVIVDGRGTPGRGSDFERAVHHDLAGPVLDDQVDALHALAETQGGLDLDRVAIRGWSFGGYLAALAVLRRPDVFHAAIAGAPVTDWRLYDTHYTERYLGDPAVDDGPYERSSLLADAPKLARPLLLIHGLADDNVVAAHTLALSGALLAAGRPHQVLPLTGITHLASQEEVAENLLLLQLDFLRSSLNLRSEQVPPNMARVKRS